MPDVTITLAHSADADDVFMWWPITGKIDPAAPHRVLESPPLRVPGWRFVALPEDIQALNRRAIERADLDVTAISFSTYALVAERYALAFCGSSFGLGYGPRLVVRHDHPARHVDDLITPGAGGRVRVAVPGVNTSAFLLLSAMLHRGNFEPIEYRFDRIIDAVAGGACDAGVLIHEAQITYEHAGLRLVADLGEWWHRSTGLPVPLGANAIRRGLEVEHGPGTLPRIAGILRRSIDYAMSRRDESLAYARTFSPLKSDSELDRYVSMYVNALTLDARGDGLKALSELFSRAFAGGGPLQEGKHPPLDMVGPSDS
jgi:1,4-dihydroxy-6-naphthoate synthase